MVFIHQQPFSLSVFSLQIFQMGKYIEDMVTMFYQYCALSIHNIEQS